MIGYARQPKCDMSLLWATRSESRHGVSLLRQRGAHRSAYTEDFTALQEATISLDIARLTGQLEALLHETVDGHTLEARSDTALGEVVHSHAALLERIAALSRTATVSLEILEPNTVEAGAGEGAAPRLPIPSPRCAHGVDVREIRAPGPRPRVVDDGIRYSALITNHLYIRDGAEVVLIAPPELADRWAGFWSTHPALVNYCTVLFQNAWKQALPSASSAPTGVCELLSAEDTELLEQLLSGLTDTSIARALGISLRTVQRRAQALQRRLGVTSRFQLGLRVGLGDPSTQRVG